MDWKIAKSWVNMDSATPTRGPFQIGGWNLPESAEFDLDYKSSFPL